jgi:hypothetical protein
MSVFDINPLLGESAILQVCIKSPVFSEEITFGNLDFKSEKSENLKNCNFAVVKSLLVYFF